MGDSDYESEDAEDPDEGGGFVQSDSSAALEKDPFFPPVHLPVAPDEDDEFYAGEDDEEEDDEEEVVVEEEKGELADGDGGDPSGLLPSRPAQPSRWHTRGRDPVIIHLNSALDHLNCVIVEMGGEQISGGDDTLTEREQRRELNS